MNLKYPLILASKSPRRQELLRLAGIPFTVQTKDTEEHFSAELPVTEVARFLAEIKAEAFRGSYTDHLILTADTTVLLDKRIMNKPADAFEAAEMLRALSGRSHKVISGVCLLHNQERISFDDSTEVFFRKLSNSEIHHYIQHYQPFDKAGAYGIQEWIGLIGIDKIIGSHYTVMGLPVHRVYEQLQQFLA
jgi:septum formation protein